MITRSYFLKIHILILASFTIILVWIFTSGRDLPGQEIITSKKTVRHIEPVPPAIVQKTSVYQTSIVATFQDNDGILLGWNKVTTDVHGNPEELAGYEILRHDDAYFAAADSVILATTQELSYFDQSDRLMGSAEKKFFYMIRARDWWCNRSDPSNRVGVMTIAINQGWNIVAVPLDQDGASIDVVFGDALLGAATPEESDLVCTFDSETQQFLTSWFNTDDSTWYGGVSSIERGKAYYIKIHENHSGQILTFTGYVPAVTKAITIYDGWNFVGNPLPTAVSLSASGLIECGFLGGKGAEDSDRIYRWCGTHYEMAWYDVTGNSWQGNPVTFLSGNGYWFYRIKGRGNYDWICPIPDGKLVEKNQVWNNE